MIRRFPARVASLRPAPGSAAAPVRDAATVMLVRDGLPGAGVEAFVLRRRAAMAFAGGMHVFPGGGVDERDGTPCPWVGPPPAAFAATLCAPAERAAALVVAAVRETFEECGVLLAQDGDGRPVDVSSAAWEAERQGLVAGEVGLADVLHRHGLSLRADLLVPWAHWLTPAREPRRFDTRFFLAAVPAGQAAREVLGEADQTGWLAARQALADADGGRVALMPPTRVCLEELAAAPCVAALFATTRRVRRVEPWLSADGTSVEVDLDGLGGGDGEPRGWPGEDL